MTIDYYTINDSETVAHGITLRSAMAGVFYKNVKGAFYTKVRLVECTEVASKVVGKTEGMDPLENVFLRATSVSSD